MISLCAGYLTINHTTKVFFIAVDLVNIVIPASKQVLTDLS